MNSPIPVALPADLAQVRTLVDAWRATASPHARLPEALWVPIMALLGSHSIRAVGRALDLDTERLRRRRKAMARATAQASQPPQFLELVAPAVIPTHNSRTAAEIAVCVERQDGLRLTVSLPNDEWARVESLVCALATQR
jgi:hypothetical protein